MEQYPFKPIGVLTTCFKEKFGIPRQSGLVADAVGVLKLNDDPFLKTAIKTLDGFSHLWVIFVFHRHDARNWKPSIRPPRLGGAKKVGVLASRSPHRPNPIGLSAVRLDRVDADAKGGPELHLSGVDFLDGTPVLDIKPYLPYADSIPEAKAGWAVEKIERTPVEFSVKARKIVEAHEKNGHPRLESLIRQMLELHPRPAFQRKKTGTKFGFRLLDFDVKWEIRGQKFRVVDVVELAE